MRRCFLLTCCLLGASGAALADDLLTELLAGKLVDPEVGQWAWYDLTDSEGNHVMSLRQAVVGEEPVGRKRGFWLETEIAPELGLKTVYKMLLTGPADDAKNIHAAWMRNGPDRPKEIPISEDMFADAEPAPKAIRKKVGVESVETESGAVEADHFVIESETGRHELWFSKKVPPTGLVCLRTPNGEMKLRQYGLGGTFALSSLEGDIPVALPELNTEDAGNQGRIVVRTYTGEKRE